MTSMQEKSIWCGNFWHRGAPDSNIVLAQIWPTSGPHRFHTGHMWAGSGQTLLAVWDINYFYTIMHFKEKISGSKKKNLLASLIMYYEITIRTFSQTANNLTNIFLKTCLSNSLPQNKQCDHLHVTKPNTSVPWFCQMFKSNIKSLKICQKINK